MPAKSESQQRLFGMVHTYQKTGKLPNDAGLAAKIKKIADGSKGNKGISDKDAKDYASTKHKGLPDNVKEKTDMSFKDFLLTEAKAAHAIKRSKQRKDAYADKMSDEEKPTGTRSFVAKHMGAGGTGGKHTDKKKGSKKTNRRDGKRQSRYFG